MCLDPKLSAKDGKRYTRSGIQDLQKDHSNEYYFIIEGSVYKIPKTWAQTSHPGGEILLLDGRGNDISIPFVANHRPEQVDKILKRFKVGYVDEKLSNMEEEFVKLAKDVANDPKWFRASRMFYLTLCLRYFSLLGSCIFLVIQFAGESYFLSVVLSAFCLGAFFQQVAFMGHDLGHNGVTHNRAVDETIGIIFGNALSGISVGWWKATHNVHHLVTNSVEYDCDIQHMPVFAVSDRYIGKHVEIEDMNSDSNATASVPGAKKTAAGKQQEKESSSNKSCDAANSEPKTRFELFKYGEGVFSHYHMKTFEFDRVSEFLLSYQHYLYYPIMMVARFNLYLQSFLLILPKESYRRWGGNRRGLELATLTFFWSWFSYLLSYFPDWGERVAFLLISHAIAGLLHVQITISHFPMPVVDGNPLASKQSFVEYQLSGSLDVDCDPSMDWFHGGLQFQAVHHLLPRVPRHNLRQLRDEVILPFCEKHGLNYQKADFVECNKRVFRTLRDTAGKINYLADAINAQG